MPNAPAPRRRSRSDRLTLAVWTLLALAGGLAAGWVDASATDVQGPALVLAAASFSLTLVGAAPALLIALLVAAGIPIAAIARGVPADPGWLIALVPSGVGAAGGALMGRVLERALSLDATPAGDRADAAATIRARRAALACVLLAVSAMGVPLARIALRDAGHPLAAWLGAVWQIITLLGWIIVAPLLPIADRELGLAVDVRGVAARAAAVFLLALTHAAALASITAMLLIPVGRSWTALAAAALIVYLPLDALVYLAAAAIRVAVDASRAATEARDRAAVERLAALRARLNPHFLFNALNGATVLARAGRTEETSRVIAGVTELLRYALDDRRAVVPLAEELAFLERYLDVQRVRFDDRLRAHIDVAPELARAAVPQLVLQPIVENAIEHGVAASLDGATVSIAASSAGDTLVLAVDDDGPGFAADATSRGIGLSHTRERLARAFGARASLVVEPRVGRGTRVVIRLPLERVP